jgi:hypothetical protein
MKVLLVGLPLSTHTRLKAESDGWKDAVPPPHSFHSTPFSTNEHEAFSGRELRDLRQRSHDGFTHIVVPANRSWKVVQETLKYDCRVHIVRLWEPLRDVQWADLKKALYEIAALDEKWLAKIAPSDLRHPLLLPPTIFRASRGIEDYWSRCDVYAEDRIPMAEKLLTVVEREHRKPDNEGGRSWIDVRKLRYKFDPSRHATSSAVKSSGRDYRFCYHVVPGFHYDVRDDGGNIFLIDIGGKSLKVKHCNITPWGHVRGGG